VKINLRCCLTADIFRIHVTFSVWRHFLMFVSAKPSCFSSGLYKYTTTADISYLMQPNRVLQGRYVKTFQEKSKHTRNNVLFYF